MNCILANKKVLFVEITFGLRKTCEKYFKFILGLIGPNSGVWLVLVLPWFASRLLELHCNV